MAALHHLRDEEELDAEIAVARADVARFTGAARRPWNEQQGRKVRSQLHVARIHLARLERLKGPA